MTPTIVTRQTPDDLLALDDGKRYELVGGEFVEKPVSFESDLIATKLILALGFFCMKHPVGQVIGETSYRCFPNDPDKVRRPDASFLSAERVPSPLPQGHCPIAPDLAVEVVSPDDHMFEVESKVQEYLDAGVRLVWVVVPVTRVVHVYRASRHATIAATGELDGEDVIPGFRLPVNSLFPTVAETKSPNPA